MTFRFTAAGAALSLALCASAATAQDAPVAAETAVAASATIAPAAPAVALAQPVTTNAVLRAGTAVTLRLMEEVTTKEKAARVGQRIRMEVASPVELNGVVVIPAGSPAEGEITSVRNKGMWGKSGHLGARALWARVGGRQIRLSGTFDDKGVTGTGGVVASVALIPLAGFFVTGTSAVLPRGGQVPAFLDEDLELAIRSAPVAPLQVGGAAAGAVAAPAPIVIEANAPASIPSAAPSPETVPAAAPAKAKKRELTGQELMACRTSRMGCD